MLVRGIRIKWVIPIQDMSLLLTQKGHGILHHTLSLQRRVSANSSISQLCRVYTLNEACYCNSRHSIIMTQERHDTTGLLWTHLFVLDILSKRSIYIKISRAHSYVWFHLRGTRFDPFILLYSSSRHSFILTRKEHGNGTYRSMPPRSRFHVWERQANIHRAGLLLSRVEASHHLGCLPSVYYECISCITQQVIIMIELY